MTEALPAIAKSSGFSLATIEAAMHALHAGGCRSAQFTIAELGGMGQWMPGSAMIGAFGDRHLRARVELLFEKLSVLCRRAEPTEKKNWWPDSVEGFPSQVASQNGMDYAYFERSNRLVIRVSESVFVYDTAGVKLLGVSQTQSTSRSSRVVLHTDRGVVELDSFALISKV